MYGYTGKILRVNLSKKEITAIATSKYQDWGGGHGIGSAIFWDLVKDKAISGFDPANVITIMTSPLTGTIAPTASRTEMQGIGVQSSPMEWFTRSNFGGSFGTLSFGNVAQPGLAEDFMLSDLTVVGSLAGGGDLGDVDLIYVPEPATALLCALAILGFGMCLPQRARSWPA